MPMGIVSDADFQSELNNIIPPPTVSINPSTIPIKESETEERPIISEEPIITGTVASLPSKGRSEGDVNVPPTLRKLIGETSVIEGRGPALALADKLGVSPSSVSAYAVGATSTSTYNNPDEGLKEYLNKSRKRVSKKALKRLHMALEHITEEKLTEAKLGEIVLVANSMSQVVKNLNPPDKSDSTIIENKPQFILFQPTVKSEDKYEVIHSRE